MVELSEQQLIERLSNLHKGHSKSAEVLCSAMLHDFDLSQPDAMDYIDLQGKLFMICHDRGDAWTKVPSLS